MKKDNIKRNQLPTIMKRRQVLGLIAAAAAAPLVSCVRGQSVVGTPVISNQEGKQTATTATPSCVVRPQQTEGPYFADEKLNRSDIRSDPSDGLVKAGLPLRLVFRVSRMSGKSCTPLSGAMVDVWQCDALGIYSDFQDFNGLFDTRGKKFLRGYQATDKNGNAEFVTVYPGWYPGRTVHIHFKIRSDSAAAGRGHEFTSQLYFDDSITDQVHALTPYANNGQRSRKNNRDGIFSRGGDQLMLQLTKEPQGYLGTFDIGLQMS